MPATTKHGVTRKRSREARNLPGSKRSSSPIVVIPLPFPKNYNPPPLSSKRFHYFTSPLSVYFWPMFPSYTSFRGYEIRTLTRNGLRKRGSQLRNGYICTLFFLVILKDFHTLKVYKLFRSILWYHIFVISNNTDISLFTREVFIPW